MKCMVCEMGRDPTCWIHGDEAIKRKEREMKQGKLIGIVGYLGAGKTTIVNEAIHEIDDTIRMGFADPLYDMIAAMGVPMEIIRDKSKWDEPQELLYGQTIRHAVRTLGTEWGRNYINQDVWSNIACYKAFSLMQEGINVIIDNVRFPSEMSFMRRYDATFIALQRPELEIDLTHSSEHHIASLMLQCSRTIWNAQSIENVAAIMRNELLDIINS